MILTELVTHILPTLKPSDTLDQVEEFMTELKISHLAYVDADHKIWLVNEDTINGFDPDNELKDVLLNTWPNFLNENMGVLEALNVFLESGLEVLPLVSNHESYMGHILKNDLVDTFLRGLSLDKTGAIIEIKAKETEFSISEIARIIEQENAHILSLFLYRDADSLEQSIVLKLDTPKISYIIVSLERYGYEVLSYFSTSEVSNLEKDRYDLLMKYLNI